MKQAVGEIATLRGSHNGNDEELFPCTGIREGQSLQSLSARTDYVMNPNKTEEGQLIRCYECKQPQWMWVSPGKAAVQGNHRKGGERKGDVIAYQLRQSFYPGRSHRNRRKRTSIICRMECGENRHQLEEKIEEEIEKAVPLCTNFEQLVNHMEQTGYEIKGAEHISFRSTGTAEIYQNENAGSRIFEEEIRGGFLPVPSTKSKRNL